MKDGLINMEITKKLKRIKWDTNTMYSIVMIVSIVLIGILQIELSSGNFFKIFYMDVKYLLLNILTGGGDFCCFLYFYWTNLAIWFSLFDFFYFTINSKLLYNKISWDAAINYGSKEHCNCYECGGSI